MRFLTTVACCSTSPPAIIRWPRAGWPSTFPLSAKKMSASQIRNLHYSLDGQETALVTGDNQNATYFLVNGEIRFIHPNDQPSEPASGDAQGTAAKPARRRPRRSNSVPPVSASGFYFLTQKTRRAQRRIGKQRGSRTKAFVNLCAMVREKDNNDGFEKPLRRACGRGGACGRGSRSDRCHSAGRRSRERGRLRARSK